MVRSLHCLTLRVEQWHTEGTKRANGKAWLWTFVTRMFTVFAVRATREATALTTFLGEAFPGIVNCHRAKMY